MRYLVLPALALLAACSGDVDTVTVPETDRLTPTAEQMSYAQSAVPDDPAIAAIYSQTCRSCHSNGQSGAPLTGHVDAWQARFDDSGMDGLIASTRTGVRAMPPMGLCSSCSDDDLRALITFMSIESN